MPGSHHRKPDDHESMTDPSGETGVVDKGKNVWRRQVYERQEGLNLISEKVFLARLKWITSVAIVIT